MNGLRENTCFHVTIWAIRSLPPNSSSPSEAGCKRGGDGGFSLIWVCACRDTAAQSHKSMKAVWLFLQGWEHSQQSGLWVYSFSRDLWSGYCVPGIKHPRSQGQVSHQSGFREEQMQRSQRGRDRQQDGVEGVRMTWTCCGGNTLQRSLIDQSQELDFIFKDKEKLLEGFKGWAGS